MMMIKTLRSCVGGYQKKLTTTFGSFRSITNTRHVLFSNGTADEEKSLTRNNLANLRLTNSHEPIPYSADVDFSPLNKEVEKNGHKKVTIVGCGQVGMAIAYSMLNQVTAGAIALIDQNREKLEGEAKDLEQGSAFHQHVRILASDEYVSKKNGKRKESVIVYCLISAFTQYLLFTYI